MNEFEEFVDAIWREDVKKTKKLFKKKFVNERKNGLTALHYACWYSHNNSSSIVKFLLSSGCNIEDEIETGLCGLFGLIGGRSVHLAAYFDKLAVMTCLINQGCTLDCVNKNGETPLDVAIRCKRHECIQMLQSSMEKREKSKRMSVKINDPQKKRPSVSTSRIEQEVPLELRILENNDVTVIMNSETGVTVLDKLLGCDDPKVVEGIRFKTVTKEEIQYWMSMRLRPEYAKSCRLLDECLLYRCIHQRYDDGVYSLCIADIVNRDSLFMGPTALETAVECGTVFWVKHILWKLVEEDESWTRAENLAKKRDMTNVLNLISNRRSYLLRKKEKGLSRLHIAVLEDDPDVIEFMLKNSRVDPDESHKNLGTALNLAYNVDHVDCARILLNYNVNVNTVDRYRQTPLHVAISNKIEDGFEHLIDHTKDLENEDIFSFTVLERSILNGCQNICERLVKKGSKCDKFVKVSTDLSTFDPDFASSSSDERLHPITSYETMYSLCLKLNRTIYPCLLETIDSHSVQWTDGDNNTLLHLSAVSLMPDLCSHLISKSANTNIYNKSKRTPLLELLKRNDKRSINEIEEDIVNTVSVLMEGGASLDVEDIHGCRILNKANEYKSEKLLMVLTQKKENLALVPQPMWLEWLRNGYSKIMRDHIPLIKNTLRGELITQDLIKQLLVSGDVTSAKMMYDQAEYAVRTEIVETFLYHTVVNKDYGLFKAMIEDDISANSSIDGGESLLNILIKKKKRKFIALLLHSKNSLWFIEKKNSFNRLPLHECIDGAYWDEAESLIVMSNSVNDEDNDGNTPLSLLLEKISETLDEKLSRRLLGFVKCLINKGADIYQTNRFYKTPIQSCKGLEHQLHIESFFRRQLPLPLVPPDKMLCPICKSKVKDCVLNCGHLTCMTCAEKTNDCFECQGRITQRVKTST